MMRVCSDCKIPESCVRCGSCPRGFHEKMRGGPQVMVVEVDNGPKPRTPEEARRADLAAIGVFAGLSIALGSTVAMGAASVAIGMGWLPMPVSPEGLFFGWVLFLLVGIVLWLGSAPWTE